MAGVAVSSGWFRCVFLCRSTYKRSAIVVISKSGSEKRVRTHLMNMLRAVSLLTIDDLQDSEIFGNKVQDLVGIKGGPVVLISTEEMYS